MIINHVVFGELEYNKFFWIKNEKEVYNFFGKKFEINIKIDGEKDEEIKSVQRNAYTEYKNSLKKINLLIEETIYDYYQQECDEYRKMFEDEADLLAPIITNKDELSNLVTLTDIIIDNDDTNRVLIFLFETTWDIEEGIGLMLVNEEIKFIGGQSEVL